jgi:hypothetical protein
MAYRTSKVLWSVLAVVVSIAVAPACRRETDGLETTLDRGDAGANDGASDRAGDRVSDLANSEFGPVEPGDGPLESLLDQAASEVPGIEAGPPDAECSVGQTRCGGGGNVYRCFESGNWGLVLCSSNACYNGQCVACEPNAARCAASGAVETCKADGSAFVAGPVCPEGCREGKCNVCMPNASTCSGTTQRTCGPDGLAWTEHTCTPPAGGGTAGCNGNRCDFTCPPGRAKMGDRCVCPGNTVECGGACVPPVETIEVPAFEKKCALPISDTCDAYTYPLTIQGCAKQVEVTVRAEPEHCAPIFVQMQVNGTAKGPRSAAIPPGGTSAPINLGPLGPGPLTLGFVATVDRAGCGVGGLVSGWGGTAKLTLTTR